MTSKLPIRLYKEVESLVEQGNDALDGDRHDDARELFQEALNLIPEPQSAYEVTYQVLGAMGDSHYFDEDFDKALAYFEAAQKVFGSMFEYFQPYLMLRIAQCLYYLTKDSPDDSRFERARTLLSNLLEVVGDTIFEGEDEVFLELASQKNS